MSRDKSEDFKQDIVAFIDHVESLEKSGENGFFDEYLLIQEAQIKNHAGESCLMDVGKLDNNLKKNRYKDIVPYDEQRVVLSVYEGDESSDYINASKIMGVRGTGDYIASQAPLTGTVNDFWRMIWEYNVEIIFMACRLIEMKKIKCSQYWSNVCVSEEYGDITVFTETEEEIMTECIRRNLRVTKGGEVHYVTQFHYCGWPDHGIPDNPADIRDIIGMMRQARQNKNAPLLVHCSAGCGRTGAIIAIDYVWTLLEDGKFDKTFSLFELICNLREQRMSLVQTPDQYALVNRVLKSLCEDRLTKLTSHTYENVEFKQDHYSIEDSRQRPKEVVRLVQRGSTKMPSTAAVTTYTVSTSPKVRESVFYSMAKKESGTHNPQYEKSQQPTSSITDDFKRKFKILAPPTKPQKPQPVSEKAATSFDKRWSSLKLQKTGPSSSQYQYTNATPSDTGLYSLPKNSTSLRVSTNSKVHDSSRPPDSRSLADGSAKGRTFSTSSSSSRDNHSVRPTRIEFRPEFQIPPHVSVPPTSPRYKGFVRLNSKNSSGQEHQHHQKQQKQNML